MFPINVGIADRAVRIFLGLALIGFAIYGPADITWKWVGWVGAVAFATAVFGTCPLYSLLGISSCSIQK